MFLIAFLTIQTLFPKFVLMFSLTCLLKSLRDYVSFTLRDAFVFIITNFFSLAFQKLLGIDSKGCLMVLFIFLYYTVDAYFLKLRLKLFNFFRVILYFLLNELLDLLFLVEKAYHNLVFEIDKLLLNFLILFLQFCYFNVQLRISLKFDGSFILYNV